MQYDLTTPEQEAATRGPFTVVSSDRRDDAILARLAPGDRRDLRAAAGVCVDADRHTRGELCVIDRNGHVVDSSVWRPGLNAARNVGLSPRTVA